MTHHDPQLDKYLQSARRVKTEMSLADAQGIINLFPPQPPSSGWTHFSLHKTKWIMLTTFFTGLFTLLLLFRPLAPPSPNEGPVERPAISSFTPLSDPDQVVSLPSATTAVAAVLPTPDPEPQTVPTPIQVTEEESRPDTFPAPLFSGTNETLPSAPTPPETSEESASLFAPVQPSPPQPPLLDRSSALPQPSLFSTGSAIIGDTTLTGPFRRLDVKGNARVYLIKSEQNMVVIGKPEGYQHSTSISESQTQDGDHNLTVSLRARGSDEPIYDLWVFAQQLEEVDLHNQAAAFYLNDIGEVDVLRGPLSPAPPASALPPAIGSSGVMGTTNSGKITTVRPFKWASCAGETPPLRVELAPFQRLVVKSNIRLLLRQGAENKADVFALPGTAEAVDFKVSRGTLTVSLKSGTKKKLTYDVQLTAATLEEVIIRSKPSVYLYGEETFTGLRVKGTFCQTKNFDGWRED